MKSGFDASARAIEMRWRWPPENSCGKRFASDADRPTWSSNSLTRACSAALSSTRRNTRSGSARMLPTRQRGLSDAYGDWNTICRRWRMRRLSASDRPGSCRSWPSISTRPRVGVNRPTVMRAIVDLPEPLSPTSAKVLPRSILNDTSSTASRKRFGRR